MKPLRTAVFPVAGLGTRSFPATKVIPKEMLTVVDKPIIQFAVEEARAAGIESLVFVTSRGKTLMEDHFDQHRELYEMLDRRGKVVELKAQVDKALESCPEVARTIVLRRTGNSGSFANSASSVSSSCCCQFSACWLNMGWCWSFA